MISSDTSCSQLVAGNYDVLVEDEEEAGVGAGAGTGAEVEVEPEEAEEEEKTEEANTRNELIVGGAKTIGSDIHSTLIEYLMKFELCESELLNSQNINDCTYANEFKLLKNTSLYMKANKANYKEGEEEYNLKKNRYKDIIPFHHTMVSLSVDQKNEPGSEYINANFIYGPSGKRKTYIACQGPLACTLNDFWRMIWECQVSIIVMACNEFESGKPKCELYWPQEAETSQCYGNIQVTLVRVRQICADFLIRKLTIRLLDTSEAESSIKEEPRVLAERTICQFHYTTWPDHGAPDAVEPILELVRLIREIQPTDCRPILVHCSAGCGRTGTICCIDYVWCQLQRKTLWPRLSLFDIIRQMRMQRMAMVQTLEQYILCHRVVAAMFINHLQTLNSSGIDRDLRRINDLLKLTQKKQLIDDLIQQANNLYTTDNNNSEETDNTNQENLQDQLEFGPVLI